MTKQYVPFSTYAVAYRVIDQIAGAKPAIEGVKARVDAELARRGLVALTMDDWRPVRELASDYDSRAGYPARGPFAATLALAVNDWQHGRIPAKYGYGSSHPELTELQAKEYPSYELLTEFINEDRADSLGRNLAVFEFTLDKLAAALLKDPIKAQFSVRFWTTAPQGYDFRGTTTKAQDEYTNEYGQKTISRQVEVSGATETEAESQAQHQKYRYQSGLYAVGDESQAEAERRLGAESAKRRAQWDKEAKEKAELLEWMQSKDRTADEIRSRKDDADRLNLMWVGGYAKGPYFQALAMAELYDENRAKAKAGADEAELLRRVTPLMVPKGAILRPIYQVAPKAAKAIAVDLLYGKITEADIKAAIIGGIPTSDGISRRTERVILLPKSRIYFYSGFTDKDGLYKDKVEPEAKIDTDYRLLDTETFALLPAAMQAYLKMDREIRTEAEIAAHPWTEKVFFHQDGEGKLFGWNRAYFNYRAEPKDFIVFDEHGKRIPANSKRHRALAETAQAQIHAR